MLITCPQCSSKFAVPVRAIGTTGRKVKCSKCQHVWFVEPVSAKLDNLLKVDYTPLSGVPARLKTKLKSSYIVLCFMFVLMFGALEILKTPEKFPTLAKELGIPNYDGLRFHDFHVESERVDNKMEFYLTGSIVNVTDKKITLPLITVKVYTKGGRIMAENQLSLIKKSIEPFEKITISPEITGISGNADRIELSFENSIEGTLR